MKKVLSFLLSLFLVLSSVCFSAFAESSVTVNISAGDTVAGEFEFVASGADDIKMSIDGESIGAGMGKPYFSFSASGLDYGGGSVYYGNTEFTELPSSSGNFKMEFDPGVLEDGDIVLTYIAASNGFVYEDIPVYGTYNIDDQNVADISVILPNGQKVLPVSVILFYPVEGTNLVTQVTESYDSSKTYTVGDGWNASTNLGGSTPNVPIYISFVFEDLLNTINNGTGAVAVVDTSAFEDGEHVLSVISNGNEVLSIPFYTDNTGPFVTVELDFGESLFKDGVIEFSASDPSGEVKIKADIDGETYHSGKSLEWVSYGRHLLTVTAEDTYGNTSMVCTEFNLCEKAGEADNTLEKLVVTPVMSGNSEEYTYNIGKSESFVFEYLGSTSENGSVSVSAYDFDAGEYVQIGVAENSVKSVFNVNESRFVSNGTVKICVRPNIYVSESDTVVWITDTQYYSNFEDLNSVYELILKYSTELYKNGKVGYLIHTGDIVDTYSPASKALSEWMFADKVHEILDTAGMPYGILAGNHDTNNTPADFSYFTRYFGKNRFTGNVWYGGNLDNNTCHYDLVTVAGTDYLFMYLGNGSEDSERTVAWANAVCRAYSDRTVILCVHSYLDVSGEYVYNPSVPNSYNHSRAYEIMNYIIEPNENIAAVLCGHVHGTCRVQRDIGDGRYIWEILSDYQYAETGADPQHTANGCALDGEGYLRLITFGEDGTMSQTTYSPLHNDYNYFEEEDDTFTVSLQTGKSNVVLLTESAAVYYAPVSGFPILPVIICAACVVCAAVIALLFMKRKE